MNPNNEILKKEVKQKLDRIKRVKDLSFKRELCRRGAEDYAFDIKARRAFENALRRATC